MNRIANDKGITTGENQKIFLSHLHKGDWRLSKDRGSLVGRQEGTSNDSGGGTNSEPLLAPNDFRTPCCWHRSSTMSARATSARQMAAAWTAGLSPLYSTHELKDSSRSPHAFFHSFLCFSLLPTPFSRAKTQHSEGPEQRLPEPTCDKSH